MQHTKPLTLQLTLAVNSLLSPELAAVTMTPACEVRKNGERMTRLKTPAVPSQTQTCITSDQNVHGGP